MLGFPTRVNLIENTYIALKNCGNSATNEEIYNHVVKQMSLNDDVLNVTRSDGAETKLQYELRWARTYLKKANIINNSSRGIWSISPSHISIEQISGSDIVQFVRGLSNESTQATDNISNTQIDDIDFEQEEQQDESEIWRSELLSVLQSMNWFAFERLCKRLLRECGFVQVETTSQTGDGGIDGYGKVKLQGLVSINVAFQCKRQQANVTSTQILQFRGALTQSIEKGIFITTSSYTRDAVAEASDPGKKPHIDLVDGEELVDLLLEHELGVKLNSVYKVDRDFYSTI